MALAYNGRIGAAVLSEGAKFVTNWDGQVLEEEWLVMLKGTKNKKEALEFMVHARPLHNKPDRPSGSTTVR